MDVEPAPAPANQAQVPSYLSGPKPRKNHYLIVIVVAVLVLVLVYYFNPNILNIISGSGSTPTGFSTFSNSNVSFQYLNGWSVTNSVPQSSEQEAEALQSEKGVIGVSEIAIVPSSLINQNLSTLTSNFATDAIIVIKTNSTSTATTLGTFLTVVPELALSNATNRVVANVSTPSSILGILLYGDNIKNLTSLGGTIQ
jgi:hypothetical protein